MGEKGVTACAFSSDPSSSVQMAQRKASRGAGVTCPQLRPWPSKTLPSSGCGSHQPITTEQHGGFMWSAVSDMSKGLRLEATQQPGMCKAHLSLPPMATCTKASGTHPPLYTAHLGACNSPGAAWAPLAASRRAQQTHRTPATY